MQFGPDLAAVENSHAAVNDAAFADLDIRADEGVRMDFDAVGERGRGADEGRGADAVAVRSAAADENGRRPWRTRACTSLTVMYGRSVG